MSECEREKESYEHARERVVSYIASPGYAKEQCERLNADANARLDDYRICLLRSGKFPPIMWVPACPYKESFELHPELKEPELHPEYFGVTEEPSAPVYSGVHARMFPFPLVIARLANFRDIYQRRHAWFKRLHELLHPLI